MQLDVKNIFLVIVLMLSIKVTSQTNNQTDEKGLKQGYWKTNWDNGQLKYEGTFKDGKPIGTMKRYFDNGALKAELNFLNSSKTYARLYYDNGVLAAEGIYIDNQKDSTWCYYSYYSKALKMKENYLMGQKEGVTIRFFDEGQKAEVTMWKKNQKHGEWYQYYPDGTKHLEANFENDKRVGLFQTFYPNGKTETSGEFVNDLMDGEWKYFLPDGKEELKIIYKNGIALNKEELEKKNAELFRSIELSKGKIPEPDETNFLEKTTEKK